MSIHPQVEANRPVVDTGDRVFVGVDSATAPEKLQPGLVSRASNTRFRSQRARGRWQTRPTGLMMQDFYPYCTEWTGASGLTGSVTDGTLTLTAGDPGTSALPATLTLEDYTHIRFESGRVVEMTTLPENGLINSYTDLGGGQVRITMLLANSLTENASVYIYDSANYDGTYTATNVTTTTFDITASYVAESGGARWITATWEVEDVAYYADQASGIFYITKDDSDRPQEMSVINEVLALTNEAEVTIDTGIFSDPNGFEYGLIATQTRLWGFRDYQRPFEITVPGGIPAGYIDIVQCFDKVLILRGDDLPVLEWDGSDSNAFSSIAATTASGYTDPIPNGRLGIVVKDRLFIVVGRDTIYHSDIGVYTRFKEFESGFRVNQGTADSITCVYPYGDEAFLVGFTRSIYLVYNIYGDLSDMSVKLISSNTGIAGRRAICTTGDDVWFTDTRGDIWPLSRVDETRQAVGGKPVSWPIRPMMDEYGYQKPETVRMLGHGDLVLVAFSGRDATVEDLDDDIALTKPNLVAVYDKVTGHWAGIDSYAYLDHAGWFYTRYGSRNQLLFVGRYGTVYQYASESGESAWNATTRAYELDAAATEHGVKLGLAWTSQDATLTIQALRDGVGTAETLENALTRNRLAWLVHGKAAWDATNTNDDFDDPDREDYGLHPSDDATGIELTATGQYTHLEQSYTEVYDIDGFHDYVQVTFTQGNAGGKASLRAVKLSAIEGNNDFGMQ